ncbi:recombinase family protein [uncultured Bacteroides sp.]|uniref:recombinase family protein n=1 Tax=uncultured Bacteroides sp. TaxID=162156 RepID=UPI0032B1B19B
MAKVGYVMNYAGYRANTDKEWMKRFGCNEIMEEQQDYELRTEWNKLLDRLNKGDELVVPKLSHVLRETRQLSYLLEYCRLKEIRLISIHDRIDSGNELFPETQMSDILNVVALLPKEAFDIRKSSDAVRKVKSRMRTLSLVDYNRIERKEFVVNMYKSGHLINEIWKASGFRSRSSVFRVLKEAGITLNRGRKKG